MCARTQKGHWLLFYYSLMLFFFPISTGQWIHFSEFCFEKFQSNNCGRKKNSPFIDNGPRILEKWFSNVYHSIFGVHFRLSLHLAWKNSQKYKKNRFQRIIFSSEHQSKNNSVKCVNNPLLFRPLWVGQYFFFWSKCCSERNSFQWFPWFIELIRTYAWICNQKWNFFNLLHTHQSIKFI